MTDIIKLLRDLPGTRPEPEPFEVWREACGLAAAAADEIEQLRHTLTLQQASYEREREIEEAEIERLRAALAELVACKKLRDALDAWRPKTLDDAANYWLQNKDYELRKPAAWDAARAALEKP